jgi:hypothetical protein
VLVEHGAHASVGRTGHDRVADPKRAALDQDGGDGAATTVEVRLDDETLRVLVGLARRSREASAVNTIASSKLVEVEPSLGRHVDEHRVAAVLLGHEAVFGQLTADLGRVGFGLVDLVDRDHDRHFGRLGVVQRLNRLRHHAVVGSDHEHRDVGRLAHHAHAWR